MNRRVRLSLEISVFGFCLLGCAAPAPAHAAALTTLYSFTGKPDGAQPESMSLTVDKSGDLYGTTSEGGAYDSGTVFELAPPATLDGGWTESVLYSFTGGNDGSFPTGPVISDGSGALYGTTVSGGSACPTSASLTCGTVFKLTPPASPGGSWTESVLHSFIGSDGANPSAGMTYKSGMLYGTTYGGGSYGYGTVFKLTPPTSPGGVWAESVLHSFAAGSDGMFPGGGVNFGIFGALYGTTVEGGDNVYGGGTVFGSGTVFKLTPPGSASGVWTERVLHSFTGSGGANPYSNLVFHGGGALYGTTYLGGRYGGTGTVFALIPPSRSSGRWWWTERVLHSFPFGGTGPLGSVIFDKSGSLYGTTSSGPGAPDGAAYKLTPPKLPGGAWVHRLLHTFTGTDGSDPEGDLVFDKTGALYGTTLEGGSTNCQRGCGTVFKLTP